MAELRATVFDYRVACRAKRLTPRTLTWYQQKLLQVCDLLATHEGVTTTEALTAPALHRVIERLDNGGRSSYTLRGYVQVIKGWLHYLEDEDLIDFRLRSRIKLPRVAKRLIKTLSLEQVDALLHATRYQVTPWLRQRDRAILHVLLDTGIRASELCGLRRCDINLDDDPHVRVIGKGDREREVGPLSDACVRECRRYLRVQPRTPQEVFFVSRLRQPLTIWGLNQLLYRLRDGAGLQGEAEVRPHVFRHTYAVTQVRAGMDIKRLSLLMGHSSVSVTEGYVRDFQQREARRPLTPR